MFGHDNDKDHDDNDKAADAAPQNNDASNEDWQHPGSPLNDDSGDSAAPANEDKDDKSGSSQSFGGVKPADSPAPSASSSSSHSTDDLIDLKRDALTKLSPLVGHLNQSPDEKFRTLMMMIQASDDQTLVKQAYNTALEIHDEKDRAQALLDIVNEINYFTQNPTKS